MYQMYPQGFMYPFGFTGSNEMSAAQAMSFKLPPGVKKVGDWIRCKDNQDRFYYHNVKTMETV